MREASADPGSGPPRRSEPAVDLAAYRTAVAELAAEVVRGAPLEEHRLAAWLRHPDIEQLLRGLPGGFDEVEHDLGAELRHYATHERALRSHPPARWLAIYLLSRIDALWWAEVDPFQTDAEIERSAELAEIHRLGHQGLVNFSYHRLPKGLPGRGRDWLHRRLAPGRRPHTAGLRLTRVRPEMLLVLHQLTAEFQETAPPGTPRLWVTSMVRTVEEQRVLRALGYPAFVRSAHASGYAFDVEVEWFHRFGAAATLTGLLLAHQARGAMNVIDEGQVWHVCLSPETARRAALRPRTEQES